jgi:hypothetical protein
MTRIPSKAPLSEVLSAVPSGPPRGATSLTEAILRHLKGPPTSREEPEWALLVQGILASCERPWIDGAARRALNRRGRAQHRARNAVALGDRSLLVR